ncbi:hypothetical protein [uncultured Chryseobacterium sp.]|uniref:hypothetical protein n=1 Tax=uncultured Chryseobacterium sp. TaxID=259322 RepID=UPI0025CCC300|nr:hypothetical protein [uncultured Chryseobacterium sp.]
MRTVKIILSAAIVALTINSCSSDRDDEVKQKPAAKADLKPMKIEKSNNQGSEASKTGDTVIIGPRKTDTVPGGGLDPIDPTDPNDPNEGGDPKGLPPRH